MAVEAVDGDQVACVWCHEGEIGRDAFNVRLLRRWEHREDSKPAPRDSKPAPRAEGGGKPFRGPREGAAKPFRGSDERPPRSKPGWDGKPREKKYFRKDG